jgi:hypothetical protein
MLWGPTAPPVLHQSPGWRRSSQAFSTAARRPNPLDLVGVKATQEARRQLKPAQHLQLTDLGQQTLQTNPPWIGHKARKRSTFAIIGEQRIEPSTGTGVELVSHPLQCCVVMRGLGRMQDAVEPVCARPGDPFARKPEGDLLLQGGRCRLSWQQVIGKPASEPALSCLVEGRDGKVVEDCAAMPPPGAPDPVVSVKRVCSNTDLAGQVSDNRRDEIRLFVRKTTVLAPERKLRCQAELAGVGEGGHESQIPG